MESILVEVKLKEGLIHPDDLPGLVGAVRNACPTAGPEGVIISGRLPVWAFAALSHLFHPRPWVATFDPRLGGAVVVERHSISAPLVGAIVPLPEGEKIIEVEF